MTAENHSRIKKRNRDRDRKRLQTIFKKSDILREEGIQIYIVIKQNSHYHIYTSEKTESWPPSPKSLFRGMLFMLAGFGGGFGHGAIITASCKLPPSQGQAEARNVQRAEYYFVEAIVTPKNFAEILENL
ncbi:uncharacterized protein PgNI_11628 [Pyricularia grisea]|uniref:MADS-box domain-containing protein n=1 Tax=Pyricularia grisea TaxID=148305 RepID=A0A6P8AP44_PYRGI|nr:uncharacterized protein PgNI_11628 [Pyricularia grisea]TLD03796.1 hypothetical protein PgNI_11628 [Pyricularia grisea]